jgi:ATP-dependent helicase/nuclease subunit B
MGSLHDGALSPSQPSGRIFTIPPGAPFLDTLARAILKGDLPRLGGEAPGPLDLAETLVYLPNRAACQALREAIMRASGGATLLPRIRPIGGAEDDALLILHGVEEREAARNAAVPAAIDPLERRMVLTQLILAWGERVKHGAASEAGALGMSIAETPAAAAELALGLMRLMDEADTEGADLARIRELLPERFAVHEQLSLDFLDIVLDAWPNYLGAVERLNPMQRRNRVMALEADALREAGGSKPVIVAGSFGNIPATAALIEAAHSLPRGAIVLPGADLWLDEASWEAVGQHPEHPQAGVRQLLTRLGVSRADIATLPGGAQVCPGNARQPFVSEALRPSSTLTAWPGFIEAADAKALRAALQGVSRIEAATELEEAAVIALILREVAETPGKTASLVTPDRQLARRVRAQLGKWGLRLPDAAGQPLAATAQGIFHQLIADVAAAGSQIAMLALLKHPLTRLGLSRGAAEAAARIVDMAAVRQPWSSDGIDALAASFAMTRVDKRQHPALRRLDETEWTAADDAVARFADAMQPLAALGRGKARSLQELAEAHREAARRIAADENGDAPAAEEDIAAEAMTAFMAALASETPGPPLALRDYPALFRSLLRLESCPDPLPGHPRLRMLGPREARLGSADLMIVAGMNEGVWPQAADPGPWLNRATREAIGLPAPERTVALAAHDFAQAMGAPEVVLTRALKCDGTPTVPSRWLLRMEALLGGLGIPDALAPKRPWLDWAATSEAAATTRPPAAAPAPCPPIEARPRELTVSAIVRLMTNPYAIYAEHILGLAPLDALEAEPGGAERGRIIHETLHRFTRRFPDELPQDCARELLAIFDGHTANFGDNARVAAFWRPRLERFARWFAETEPERRKGVARIFAQVTGEMTIETPAGPFTLRASADRIDLHEDGRLAIYDYKSGSLPSAADVKAFKAPQLPLQALVAEKGELKGVKSGEVAALVHISAKGGEPAGEESRIASEETAALAASARDGLDALIGKFDDSATPYTAMRRSGFTNGYRHDAYAHLARVETWSGNGDEGQ